MKAQNEGTVLSNKAYDLLKFLTIVLLPAVGTLYFALATIWSLPAGEQILGTLLAIQAFIGAIIGISNKQYEASGAKYVGEINVIETDAKDTYSLEMDGDPEDLKNKKEATFKVNAP